jgi:antitoxin VapB
MIPSHFASETSAPNQDNSATRSVHLFRNGANQAVRIPKEFELPGKVAVMRREGDRLILEPIKVKAVSLAEAMKNWETLDAPVPDVDAGLLPLDDIVI